MEKQRVLFICIHNSAVARWLKLSYGILPQTASKSVALDWKPARSILWCKGHGGNRYFHGRPLC